MSDTVGKLIEDAEALQLAMQTHKTELTAKGFKETRFENFDTLFADVVKKDSTHTAAHATAMQSTQTQNDAVADAQSLISKILDAAKSAFGKKDKTTLKEFTVGTKKSNSVGKLSERVDYLAGVCTKYHDELAENGLTDEDFAGITTTYGALVSADAVQEHSKKLQVVATSVKDDSVAALKDEMSRVRSFVKSAFSKDKAIQEEFKPNKGGGRSGGGTNPPDPPPPSQT